MGGAALGTAFQLLGGQGLPGSKDGPGQSP